MVVFVAVLVTTKWLAVSVAAVEVSLRLKVTSEEKMDDQVQVEMLVVV